VRGVCSEVPLTHLFEQLKEGRPGAGPEKIEVGLELEDDLVQRLALRLADPARRGVKQRQRGEKERKRAKEVLGVQIVESGLVVDAEVLGSSPATVNRNGVRARLRRAESVSCCTCSRSAPRDEGNGDDVGWYRKRKAPLSALHTASSASLPEIRPKNHGLAHSSLI